MYTTKHCRLFSYFRRPPTPHKFSPTWPAPGLMFCFADNLLSPISADHMFMGVGPSAGAWETYQWPYIKKKMRTRILPPPTAVNCQLHLRKEYSPISSQVLVGWSCHHGRDLWTRPWLMWAHGSDRFVESEVGVFFTLFLYSFCPFFLATPCALVIQRRGRLRNMLQSSALCHLFSVLWPLHKKLLWPRPRFSAAQVCEYKHKCFPDNLTAWPFSKITLRPVTTPGFFLPEVQTQAFFWDSPQIQSENGSLANDRHSMMCTSGHILPRRSVLAKTIDISIPPVICTAPPGTMKARQRVYFEIRLRLVSSFSLATVCGVFNNRILLYSLCSFGDLWEHSMPCTVIFST